MFNKIVIIFDFIELNPDDLYWWLNKKNYNTKYSME